MSAQQISSLSVYTKKLNKVVYHLATFNEPLSKKASASLPAHVIEEPVAEAESSERDNYANVHQFVRHQNKMGQDFNDLGLKQARSQLPQKKKAILVYEEQQYSDE